MSTSYIKVNVFHALRKTFDYLVDQMVSFKLKMGLKDKFSVKMSLKCYESERNLSLRCLYRYFASTNIYLVPH